ncbi:hypothetical protein VTN96DRAFT_1022 [Rasamsonia emersonii]
MGLMIRRPTKFSPWFWAAKTPPRPCENTYPDTSIHTVYGELRAVAEIKTPWTTDLWKTNEDDTRMG